MKAIAINTFGSKEKLFLKEIPDPQTADNEILIRVANSGVNPVDWKIREGWLKKMLPHEFPLILGWDTAGTVKSVGKNVLAFQEGDEVFAFCQKDVVKWGTYAEYVAVKADDVAIKPASITMAQAAGIPLVALTAWQALYDSARIRYGETVLIHAAAGGVGTFAVQFAHKVGARVIGTASKHNHNYVKELGADIVLDYHEDLKESIKSIAPGGLDVVLDCVGSDTLEESASYIRPHGRLVSIVSPHFDQSVLEEKQIQFHWVFVRPNGSQLNHIGNLTSLGKLRPPKTEEFPWEKVEEAFNKNKEGHVQGKIVLKIQ